MSSTSSEPLLGGTSSWLELLHQNTSEMESSSEDTANNRKKPVKMTKRTVSKPKRPAKKRRTTYDIRKQQKADILAEMSMLETKLQLLKNRVLIEQGEANSTIERTEAANSVMQEIAQNQHVTIAGMQSMLVAHMQQSFSALHPTQKVIKLSADRAERQRTLMAMKEQKLREAKRFITAGGLSVIRVDNAPLSGTTVRVVFDAIIQAMQNAEILISELFGSITIREDTDFNASDISQIRLVSSTTHGAVVESNSVIFSEMNNR
eukprot:jgi/Phyca11/11806/fgenesh1_pm.PHYCAscaffold_82_\